MKGSIFMKKNIAKICLVVSAMLISACSGGRETSEKQESSELSSSSQITSVSQSEQSVSESELSQSEELSSTSGGQEISSEESSEESIEESSEEESSEESLSIIVPTYISLMQGKENVEDYYGGHLYAVYNGYSTVYCLDDGEVAVSVTFDGNTLSGIENEKFYPAVIYGRFELNTYTGTYILRSSLNGILLVNEDDVPALSFDLISPVIESPTYGKTDANSKYLRPFSFRGFVGGWDGGSFYFGKAGLNEDYIDDAYRWTYSSSMLSNYLKDNYQQGAAIIINGYVTYNDGASYPSIGRIISSRYDEAFVPNEVTFTTLDGESIIENVSTNIRYTAKWTVDKKDIETPYPDYWVRGYYSQKGSYGAYRNGDLKTNEESYTFAIIEGYAQEGEDLELSYNYQGVAGTIIGTNYSIMLTDLSLYINGSYAENFTMTLGEKVKYEIRQGGNVTTLPMKLSEDYTGLVINEDNELCAYASGSYTVKFVAYGADYFNAPRTQTITVTVNGIETAFVDIKDINTTTFSKPTLVTMQGFVHIDGDDAYLLGEPYSGDSVKVENRNIRLRYGSEVYSSHIAIDGETGEFVYTPNTSTFDIGALDGETYVFHFIAQTIDGVNQYSLFIRGQSVDVDLLKSVTINTNAETLGIPAQQTALAETWNVDKYYVRLTIAAVEGVVKEIKWHGEFYDERVLTPEEGSTTNNVIVIAPRCRGSVFDITFKARTMNMETKTITNTDGFYPQGYKYDHDTVDSYTVAGLNVGSWGVSNRNSAIEFYCDYDVKTSWLQINLPAGAIIKSFDVDWSYSVSSNVQVANAFFRAMTGSGEALRLSSDAYSQTEDGKVFVLNGGVHNVADTYLKLSAYYYCGYNDTVRVNVTRILINYIYINQVD